MFGFARKQCVKNFENHRASGSSTVGLYCVTITLH